MVSERKDCPGCGARIIVASIGGGLRTVLDYDPDPEGTVAAKHEASGGWTARHLLPGEPLMPAEKRFRRHLASHPGCAPEAAERQRDAAKAVRAALAEKRKAQRNRRGKRAAAQPYLGFRRGS